MRCSLNPSPTHFVLRYLDRYIDKESGLARDELSGKKAYFVFNKGEMITSWDYDELLTRYPDKKPRTYTFFPSRLDQNPAMLASNSEYAEDLEANDPANAELLLKGNWLYMPAANGVWERSTITPAQIVESVPENCIFFRAWDKASSKPAKEGGDSKQLDPDYTASVMFAKDPDGFFYVIGDYITDKDGQQLGRFREKVGKRDKMIEQQALLDVQNYGENVWQILPKDPAQAGAAEYMESAKKLSAAGFLVKSDPTPSNKSKQLKFEPFAAACYNGLVYWVKNTFDTATWDYTLLELENFNPLSKNNGYHDDVVDAYASGFAAANKELNYLKPSELAAALSTISSSGTNRFTQISQSAGVR